MAGGNTESVKMSCEVPLGSDVKMDMFSDTWGFNIDDLYKIAVTFFKEKVGSKALQITYKDKLRMVSLTKQVTHGPYEADAMPEVGFLDVVGNDRKLAWQSLGSMSREDAMSDFVSFLRKTCPLFAPYVQAQLAERQEQERKRKELEEEEQRSREEADRQRLAEAAQQQEDERKIQLAQEMMIRDALNKQTAVQFRQYAEQQFPGDPTQQEALIRQLQDQHYIQYMQQCYSQQQQLAQQLLPQQQQLQQLPIAQQQQQQVPLLQPTPVQVQHQTPQQPVLNGVQSNSTGMDDVDRHETTRTTTSSATHSPSRLLNGIQKSNDVSDVDGLTATEHVDEDTDANEMPAIAEASMWTRKDIKEFKQSLQNDTESVIKVGSGEIVTVRVPTHEDGSCLFWEFATDSYDIGFGVFFEWTVDASNQVSVHVNESSEDEEDETGPKSSASDAEAAAEPPTEEIVPPFRRESQTEVYCGSHVYPGRGVYLLKFDNSYSLWRGKTLYYRVYYTR